jgi:hypothetical protein
MSFFLRVTLGTFEGAEELPGFRRTLEVEVPYDLRPIDIDRDGEVHPRASCLRRLCRKRTSTRQEWPVEAWLVEDVKARYLAGAIGRKRKRGRGIEAARFSIRFLSPP